MTPIAVQCKLQIGKIATGNDKDTTKTLFSMAPFLAHEDFYNLLFDH